MTRILGAICISHQRRHRQRKGLGMADAADCPRLRHVVRRTRCGPPWSPSVSRRNTPRRGLDLVQTSCWPRVLSSKLEHQIPIGLRQGATINLRVNNFVPGAVDIAPQHGWQLCLFGQSSLLRDVYAAEANHENSEDRLKFCSRGVELYERHHPEKNPEAMIS